MFCFLTFIVLNNVNSQSKDYENILVKAYNKFDNNDYLDYSQTILVFDSSQTTLIDSMTVFFQSDKNNYIMYEPNKIVNILLDSFFVEISILDSQILINKVNGLSKPVNPINEYLNQIKKTNGKLGLISSNKSELKLGLKFDTFSAVLISITIDTLTNTIKNQGFYTQLTRKGIPTLVYCNILFSSPNIVRKESLITSKFCNISMDKTNPLVFTNKFKNYKIKYR